jgi:hypothetical protein
MQIKNYMPMKNLFLLLTLGFAMMAHASTYNYLVFTNQAGTTTAFEVSNLTLKVNGSELQVSNADGTVNLVLTELVSMQFSIDKTATSVENVLNADAPVHVYSVPGAWLGSYGSMLEAAKCLNVGTYVISNGYQSQTVVIK